MLPKIRSNLPTIVTSTWAIIRPITVYLLALSFAASIPPAIIILAYYDPVWPTLCASKECIQDASTRYEQPFKVFSFSFYAIAVAAAVAQLHESQKARAIQEKSSHAANCISHLNAFSDFVRSEVEKFEELDISMVTPPKLHQDLFPGLSMFSISLDTL